MRFMRSLFAVPVLVSALFAADTYKIDPAHSSANFSVRHMLISNVPGRFSDVSGAIVYDEQDVTKSSVEAVVKTASVNTDNANRDRDLRSPNFFDVEKYPEMTFKSQRVEKRGDQLVAIGTLTIKDVSKQVELPFELSKAKTPMGIAIGVSASIKINRQDYGVAYNRLMEGGGAVVGNDVKIDLNVEARPAQPPPASPKPAEKK